MSQTRTVGRTATTVARGNDGALRVTYHSTDVVTVNQDGSITLNTGGWRSKTTKLRMNQASNQYGLGYQVWQKDWEWFVTWQGKDIPFEGQRIVLEVQG